MTFRFGSKDGKSCVQLAAERGNERICERLLGHGSTLGVVCCYPGDEVGSIWILYTAN